MHVVWFLCTTWLHIIYIENTLFSLNIEIAMFLNYFLASKFNFHFLKPLTISHRNSYKVNPTLSYFYGILLGVFKAGSFVFSDLKNYLRKSRFSNIIFQMFKMAGYLIAHDNLIAYKLKQKWNQVWIVYRVPKQFVKTLGRKRITTLR